MKIIIKSLDAHGQDYEHSFELEKIVNINNLKEYHYNDEFGFNKIIIKNNVLEIYRKGIINSKQVFKLGEKTTFMYVTEQFKAKYEIFTKKMSIVNGKISLKYDIMENEELINKIKLEINFK